MKGIILAGGSGTIMNWQKQSIAWMISFRDRKILKKKMWHMK